MNKEVDALELIVALMVQKMENSGQMSSEMRDFMGEVIDIAVKTLQNEQVLGGDKQ